MASPRNEGEGDDGSDDHAATQLVPGAFIGRYKIRECIGEGGMGVVFAADDTDLGRVVAIKLLRGVEGSEAEVHQRRLLREAQALARVSHRNLVTVFDVGTHHGRVWVAMEYVSGETLDAWLARTHRSWREIIEVFVEAGRGLAAVHAAGLIHRDFKPGNVIVGKDGTVQVLDFGLAAQAGERLLEESDARAKPALDALAATLTETGGIMGTPAYMAPEQFMTLVADARCDQFAFCVALYEALYGHRPFKGRDLTELMIEVVEGLKDHPPPLPGVPDDLRVILARGLRPKPAERFPDMEALLAELERVLQPATPGRASGGWRRFTLGMIVGGGLLGLGVGAWLANAGDSEPSTPPSEDVEPQKAPARADEETVEAAEVPADDPEDGTEGSPVAAPPDLPEPVPGLGTGELPSLEDLRDLEGQDTEGTGGAPAADEVGGLPAPPDPTAPDADAGEPPSLDEPDPVDAPSATGGPSPATPRVGDVPAEP